MTPTARSTEYLRKLGCIVAKVEQRIHMPNAPFPVTRDAFGFGDLLIAKPDRGIALVQVTSADHVSHRVAKICGLPKDTTEKELATAKKIRTAAREWLLSGGRILVHGWRKGGRRGEKKRWIVNEHEVTQNEVDNQAKDVTAKRVPTSRRRVPGIRRRTVDLRDDAKR